jgi:predicted DNA-binding transcriptional regulator AlpA
MTSVRNTPLTTSKRGRTGRRRIRPRTVVALVMVALLTPVLYSYITTVTRPSSLPLGVRSVEWLRANGGAWLVDDAERLYYSWRAPKKGGPQLTTLPQVGLKPAPPIVHSRAVVYRPFRIRPLLRPALAGEGRWAGTGPVVGGRAPVLVTAYRVDPDYPRVIAYVAWIDHTRTRTALYPGRYEPPGSGPRGPMEVPTALRGRLLATFNSGFTYADGHGGFFAAGRSFTPLQVGMATLVGYRDGRVDVRTWRGGTRPGASVAFARQNLPLIVSGGRLNPALDDSSRWGNTLGNAVRVWRSGVGVDRHGNLIYAAANYQTAPSLARILVHAGAVRAMELDINPEWPSFISYARPGGGDPTKLVPNGMQSEFRYLRPDDRDFFAVYRTSGSAR